MLVVKLLADQQCRLQELTLQSKSLRGTPRAAGGAKACRAQPRMSQFGEME